MKRSTIKRLDAACLEVRTARMMPHSHHLAEAARLLVHAVQVPSDEETGELLYLAAAHVIVYLEAPE